MLGQDADVVKIAVMANTPADVARVLKLQREATKPTVAFCMGELGFPTRFTALKYGAPWIYAAFNRERDDRAGPAQRRGAEDDLSSALHRRRHDVLGVAGDPVAHSLSPLFHNQAVADAAPTRFICRSGCPQDQLAEIGKPTTRCQSAATA